MAGLASVFILGVGAQWLAWRWRLPSIALLLAFGFAVGPVLGWLKPDELLGRLLFPFVSLAVSLILFEGGLSLKLIELKQTGGVIRNLVTIGAAVTWILSSIGAGWMLGLPPAVAAVFGAILVVTGPTVVGPLLNYIKPTGRVRAIAKWEGIVIDPIGATLAVLVFGAVDAIHSSGWQDATREALLGLIRTLIFGGGVGAAFAALTIISFRRNMIPDFLHVPFLVMIVTGAYTLCQLIQEESGFFAVTLMGVMLANQRRAEIRHVIEFKENLRTLLISSLFILLAARLEWSELKNLGPFSLLFLAFMIFIVRPLAVLISTLGSELNWKERAFLGWLAPRGVVAAAVASVFANKFGADGAPLIAETFVIITGTVLTYGLSGPLFARRLGIATPDRQGVLIAGAHPQARQIGSALRNAGVEVVLVDSNRDNVHQAHMSGLTAYYASILSDYTLQELDLDRIGILLAMTPNEEVNTLAALQFSEHFGRSNVYQLAAVAQRARTSSSPQHRHGRLLFARHATLDYLEQRFASGAQIKKNRLSTEYTFQHYQRQYGNSSLILFTINPEGNLKVRLADDGVSPKAGDTILALIDPAEKKEGDSA